MSVALVEAEEEQTLTPHGIQLSYTASMGEFVIKKFTKLKVELRKLTIRGLEMFPTSLCVIFSL